MCKCWFSACWFSACCIAGERWNEFNTMVEGFASARTWRRQRSNNVELIFDQIGLKQTWRPTVSSRDLREQWCWIVEAVLMCQFPTMLLHRRESKKLCSDLQELVHLSAVPHEEGHDSDSLFPSLVKTLGTGRSDSASECFQNVCIALRLVLTHIVTDAVWMPLYTRILLLSQNKKEPGEAEDNVSSWPNVQVWGPEKDPSSSWKPLPRSS